MLVWSSPHSSLVSHISVFLDAQCNAIVSNGLILSICLRILHTSFHSSIRNIYLKLLHKSYPEPGVFHLRSSYSHFRALQRDDWCNSQMVRSRCWRSLSPSSRSFFSIYSGISDEDLIPHLHSIVSSLLLPELTATQIQFSANVPGKSALTPA